MEEIPAPNFYSAVRWLRVGDLQLHLFQSEVPAPARHHFGIDVDDFEAAYRKAKELGIEDDHYFPADVYELPDGAVQMYVRDPAGNLVEINWPDVTTLDHSVVTGIEKRDVPQTGDALRATLYLHRDRALG
jgi:lactoylglutathione lyase